MDRYELKYIVGLEQLPALWARFMPFVNPDSFARKKASFEYTTRSLYFDTAALQYYQDKLDGVAYRKKLRVRVYDERLSDSVAFMEIKRRRCDFMSKHRAPVYLRHIDNLFADGNCDAWILTNNGFVNSMESARRFLYHIHAERLYPTLLVTYDREAYQGLLDPSFRLTFDKHLRFAPCRSFEGIYQEKEMYTALTGQCIIEFKFHSVMPLWVHSILSEFNLRRTSASKYCLGIDSAILGNGAWRPPLPSMVSFSDFLN